MINTEINNIWNYLLSNKLLSDSLGGTTITNNGVLNISLICPKPFEKLQINNTVSCDPIIYLGTGGGAGESNGYGIKLICDNNGYINSSRPISGIINLMKT